LVLAIVTKHKDFDPTIKIEPDIEKHGHIIGRFGRKIKPSEIIFFTSQLALMLEIGTSLTNAMKTAADQANNPTFEAVIRKMVIDIEEGRQLSEAMRRHPKIFNTIFISMVKAGETGGFLKEVLERLVEMQEKRQALITQIRSTLTYPLVLCVLSVAVIIFVLAGILPKFTVLFAGKESLLPLTTRSLMALSASFRGYWWVYIVAGAGIIFGFRAWKAGERGRAVIDKLLVGAPLVNRVANKIYTSQLLRTLGQLMEGQVPLIEALKVTRSTFDNRHYRNFIDQIIEHVEQGGRFARPFADDPYVMESVKQMVATGEDAGNLPRVMLRLADFYDNEIEQELKNIASMLEPLTLIIMGVVVGLIVSSVILPIFKIAHTIH